MLSIGEFSNICHVSTKTLRYYAEIGLILPSEINTENGYRYYSISQLETMLLINRLKSYHFSLDEIKSILNSGASQQELLLENLQQKKRKIEQETQALEKTLKQLNQDLRNLKNGKSMMSYLDDIDIELVHIPVMHLVSIRKMVKKESYPEAYAACFGQILQQIESEQCTIAAPPMVLFHSREFTDDGMDTEFAIPVEKDGTHVREFQPGLCLKTVHHGPYSGLSSIYTKQLEYAEKNGYTIREALYEVYVTDPTEVHDEDALITEVYCPVQKRKDKK